MLAEECAHPPDHLLGGKRLGDIPCRADFATAQDVGSESPGGQHDDREVLGSGVSAEPGREIESVGRGGQGDIQQRQIHLPFGEELLCRFGRRRLVGRETFAPKLERQNSPDIRLIVDDQNTAPHMRKSRESST